MRRTVIILLATSLAAGAGWLAWPRTPALVKSLRGLPDVAKVDYVGPGDAPLVVIHVRDWHFVPPDLCKLEGIDFDANLTAVEKVQEDELTIARFLIREHGLKAIYSEGLSEASMPDLRLRLDLLDVQDRLLALDGMNHEERRHQRELTLEVGIPGRLLRSREIDKVLPIEDGKALDEAGPMAAPKGVRYDASKLEARRKAMVANLPKAGTALVVLGGSHDLSSYLGAGVLYIRVTPRNYPGD